MGQDISDFEMPGSIATLFLGIEPFGPAQIELARFGQLLLAIFMHGFAMKILLEPVRT